MDFHVQNFTQTCPKEVFNISGFVAALRGYEPGEGCDKDICKPHDKLVNVGRKKGCSNLVHEEDLKI